MEIDEQEGVGEDVHKESSCLKREVGKQQLLTFRGSTLSLANPIQWRKCGEIFGMIRRAQGKYDCLLNVVSFHTFFHSGLKKSGNPLLRKV